MLHVLCDVCCACVVLGMWCYFIFYFAISVQSCVPTLGLLLVVVSGLETKTGFE